MRKISVFLFISFIHFSCVAQTRSHDISKAEVQRILSTLAADEMKGRKVFSPEIDKAADFIAAEFKSAGLKPAEGDNDFLQSFGVVSAEQESLQAVADGQPVEEAKIIVVTQQPTLNISNASGFETTAISKEANLFREARKLAAGDKNLIVAVDESFANSFARLKFLKRNAFPQKNTVVFLLQKKLPSSYSIQARHIISENKLANVVGILPGKSKKEEYVIFSAHYDHIGIGKAVNSDSVYNGANDDASGTTAVIMLAKHFAKTQPERTIVFAAFTAEESGGFGSQYFSRQFDPGKVMAMMNIEMIGTGSKWGKNSAYITGYEKTDMGKILQQNLKETAFNFYPDPYPDQQLFYRSDNATLARLGVPAHTVSTSKMDSEPNYHQPSDEVATLDLDNMAEIIRSIGLSAASIISGKDTPARVKVEELR